MTTVIRRSNWYSILIVAALLVGSAHLAVAEVRVNINLGPPPVVAAPPEMVLIPGSQLYFAPGLGFDVFFYDGYWWSPRGERWYRSSSYNGPWRVVGHRYVPRAVYGYPRDYRHIYRRERHVPYGQWKKEHEFREHRERGMHEERREYRHDRGERGHRGGDR